MNSNPTFRHLLASLKFSCLLFLFYGFYCNAAPTEVPQAKPYEDHTDFEHYSVYYNVFNSTFIPASVAANYGIKRSEYENLINVSISPKGQYGALPARLSGTVRNLMQQQKILDFIEIKEKDATYYIAPIRITNEEVLHFDLQVFPEDSEKQLDVKFSKKLYSEP